MQFQEKYGKILIGLKFFVRVYEKENSMIYKCSLCEFVFERRGETIQCPNCGKYSVSEAEPEEQEKFRELQEQSK